MIHNSPVFAAFLLVSSACIFSASDIEADWDADIEETATCADGAEDCISGYTSLLQESVLVQRGKGRTGKGGHSSDYGAYHNHEGVKKLVSTKMILGGVAVFGILFYLFILRPAMTAGADAEAAPGSPQRSSSTRSFSGEEEEHKRIHDPLGEDTYSLAIAILVRDLRSLALGEPKPGLKMSRVAFAILLVFLTIGIQISVVVCTKQFVTPNQVADIRDAYDNFEKVMYNGHTYLNANGKARGLPGYFNASAFADLKDDDRTAACNIPLSQLNFLFLILTVWSITCMAQLRQNIETFMALIYYAGTKESMEDCLMHWEDAIDTDDEKEKPMVTTASGKPAPPIPVQVIVGLTLKVKAFLVLCVFLPEFGTTSYILWLGSRWLTATNDFGNIVCNAVALEFILQLKYLLYAAFASERSKRDLNFTAIAPPWRKENAGYLTYFISMVWLILAGLWVYLYVYHLQHVLPDYKWDVHQVCNSWLHNILKASGGNAD